MSEGLARECVAALAIVLTLPGRTDSPLRLPCLRTSLNLGSAQGHKDDRYDKLFDCLSSCITLSCSAEGIDSLLCSIFFEPTVPCNLIGAHLSGVTKAIDPLKNDPRTLAPLMAKKYPKILPLWLATIWSGRASHVLQSVMGGLPPTSLPVASWTGTVQSFVQAEFHSITGRPESIPRAREYSVAYLIGSGVVTPFTPSPPFGETTMSNLSLEIRTHLEHHHRPMLYRTSWILDTGEELPDQQGSKAMPQLSVRLPLIAQTMYDEGLILE